MSQHDLHVYPDPSAVARAAAQLITQSAAKVIQQHNAFSLVLSGGSTPKLLHQLLADSHEPFRNQIDWPKVQIYFGDERAVPPDHPDSNYKMAHQTLLSKVPISSQNVHRIRGEINPEQAAIEYGQLLKSRFADAGPDLTLLGMGDDGHTASLFPHTPALEETRHRCVAQFVEMSTTGPSWRITLTAPFLNRSQTIAALVTGPSKAPRLHEVLHGPKDPHRLPIQLIAPSSGKMVWIVDQAAAANLQS